MIRRLVLDTSAALDVPLLTAERVTTPWVKQLGKSALVVARQK